MNTTYFIIPRSVLYYCILPALFFVFICLMYYIINLKKKGTYYYSYNLNMAFSITSILLSLLIFPLLLGYSIAMSVVLYKKLIIDVSFLIIIVLILLPLVPFSTLIFSFINFTKNLDGKKYLDEYYEELAVKK